MVMDGTSELSGDDYPEEAGVLPQPPAANDIEAIFCPGDRIGGYEIERVLGIGSTAVVYGAVQLSLNRHVALKVPLARLNRHPHFAQHFEREAPRIAALNHPNLVNILDSGHQGDLHYFVLEYVEGVPLETAIVRGILSYGDYLAVIRQVREALKYVHGEGLPHLDVKPSNIFLSRNGQVKVGDFAVAHMALALGERGNVEDIYRAPELIAGRSGLDPRADVYSLGITYHRMFCRAFPENGQVQAAVLNPALPKAVDGVLQEAIAANPEDRYESVQRFTVELLSSLMGMAAFFQIDQIAEESDETTDSVAPTQPVATETETAPSPAVLVTEAAPVASAPAGRPEESLPVGGASVAAAPELAAADSVSAPNEETVPAAGKKSMAPVWACAGVAALLAGIAAFAVFPEKGRAVPQPSPAPAPAAAAVAQPTAPPATPAAEPLSGVLEGWLPSNHPEVQKALADGRPVAIYFRRGGSLPWADFEANVLGSDVVRQKMAGVVRAVEDLDGAEKPLVSRFGKGTERVLTVVGRHGRSIARFNADTNADQVAYALSLM